MKLFCCVALVALLWASPPVPLHADVQVWDAWVYGSVRIYGWYDYDLNIYHPSYDIRNDPCDVYANPIECAEDDYYAYMPDRFRFTFDGLNLRLNSSHISTVGGSSKMASDLLLSGLWATCGTVANNTLTPDPYATFVGDHIQWATNTPLGYTANLLLGYSFAGDGAASYVQNPPDYGRPPIVGTLIVRTYSPFMRPDYPDFYDIRTHIFTATYVPEPSSLFALAGGMISLLGIRRRKA